MGMINLSVKHSYKKEPLDMVMIELSWEHSNVKQSRDVIDWTVSKTQQYKIIKWLNCLENLAKRNNRDT